MTITEVSAEIKVSPSALYGWFMGKGRPMLLPLDRMMVMVGHHYKIADGARPGAARLPDIRYQRNADKLREPVPANLHPLLVEVDSLWRATRRPLVDGATAIGCSRGPVYRWFLGTTEPALLDVDALLGTINKRLTVVRGARRVTPLPGTQV